MLRYLWSKLQEPRVATACFAVAWAALLTVGAVAVGGRPHVTADTLGHILTAIWGWFELVGAALGLIGCLSGWWWLERSGIIAATTGALVHLVVVATMTPPGAREIVAGLLVVIIAGMAARWHMIRGALADPTRGPA